MFPDILEKKPGISHFEQSLIFREESRRWIKAFHMPNYNIGMHTQAFFEINIILKGNGMHYIENSRVPVKRGDVFMIPPYVPHGYYSNPKSSLDVYHILISDRFLVHYNSDLQSLPFFFTLFNIEPFMRATGSRDLHLHLEPGEFRQITYLLNDLAAWNSNTNTAVDASGHYGSLMLISYLCSFFSAHHAKEATESREQSDCCFMQSISAIYSNYQSRLTIDDLAKIAGMSRTAYIQAFKKIFHTAPAKFIRKHKLQKAKELLGKYELSILEIAHLTGFCDAPHFYRCFVRAEDCSPLAYRKKLLSAGQSG